MLGSDALLEMLGGAAELMEPFVVSDQAVIAGSGTSDTTFVRANKNRGLEGILFSYGFYWQPEALQTSPVKLVLLTTDETGSGTSARSIATHRAQIGDETFAYRLRNGLFLPFDRDVGLALTNGETAAYLAKGWLEGVAWPKEKRAQVRAALESAGVHPLGAPWPRGSVFRGD